jgi:CRP-like cAMP-binding protein
VDDQPLALQRLLARNPLFSTVTADEAAYLLAVGQRRILPANQQLFVAGSPGDELFIVLDGSVHVLIPSQDGDVLIERFHQGDVLGEVAVLDDQPPTAPGVAAKPTTVLAIRRGDVRAFLERFPRYRDILIRILAQRLRRTSSLVSEMLTVESGVVLPPDQHQEPQFQATIAGYGRYGNSYIGPKYAKRGFAWEVAAIVDPLLTPARFAVSVLGRARPDTPIFHTFDEWHDRYFKHLSPEQRAWQVVEIPLKPELVYDQALRYIDAGVRQLILPKPVVMNETQLADLTRRVAEGQVKAAVASQWHYSDFPRIIRREVRHMATERGGTVRRVEIEFSKENGLAYATPPPLLELPHVLQLLGSIGLVDFTRDSPEVSGTAMLVALTYRPEQLEEGIYVRASTDYQPPTERKQQYPSWDYQERTLKVWFDESPFPELAIDFWIKFIRSGDIAIRPGQLRIYDRSQAEPRFVELQFVDDQLLRMNRAIYAAFAQEFAEFQQDPRVLSLERYGPIGRQLMAIQEAWERATAVMDG